MKESTKLFFSQYKEAVESSNNDPKDILDKYNQIREKNNVVINNYSNSGEEV